MNSAGSDPDTYARSLLLVTSPGRARAAYKPTDLAAFTGELASVFRAAVERTGPMLTVCCPPFDQPVFVDRDIWEKVVLNLLSSALKFTFEGEITVSIRQTGASLHSLSVTRERAFRQRKCLGFSNGFTGWRAPTRACTKAAESAWHWCKSCSSCSAAPLHPKAFWGRKPRSPPACLWGRGTCPLDVFALVPSTDVASDGVVPLRDLGVPTRAHLLRWVADTGRVGVERCDGTLRGAQRLADSCFHCACMNAWSTSCAIRVHDTDVEDPCRSTQRARTLHEHNSCCDDRLSPGRARQSFCCTISRTTRRCLNRWSCGPSRLAMFRRFHTRSA